MKLATYALTLCFAFGMAASATSADTPGQSKTISADALLAGLKGAEERVHNFSVSIHWTKYFNPLGPTRLDAPVKTQADADYVFEFPKKVVYDYTSEHFTVRPDKQVSIYPIRGKLAFDGKVCHVLEGPRNFDGWHGEIWSYATWNAGPDLGEFTTNYFQEPISSSLKKHGIVFAGRTEWEGRPVIIIETPPINSKTGSERRKLSYWIDVERNWLVVRRAILVQYRPEQKWQEYQRVESRGQTAVRPGVWLPRKLVLESLQVTEKQPAELAWRYEGEARDWVIDPKLPANRFELDFPPGTAVDDYTVSPQRAFIVPKDKSRRSPMFDEKADARAAIAAALTVAKMQGRRVLITWGGNGNAGCNKLRDVFEDDDACERILIDEYELVPVAFGTNEMLFEQYVKQGERGGIPFLTVLDSGGRVVANQKGEVFESSLQFDARKIEAFLRKSSVPPQDAERVLAEGLAQARRESKRVFLHLGAPWCGPCRNLDRFLRENHELFAIDFVDVKIDLDRMTNAAHVAERYRTSKGSSIPWVAILDGDGKLLATSDDPSSENFGFPETSEHMRLFFAMLRKTSLRTTAQQLALLEMKLNEDRLRRENARRQRDKAARLKPST